MMPCRIIAAVCRIKKKASNEMAKQTIGEQLIDPRRCFGHIELLGRNGMGIAIQHDAGHRRACWR